MCVKPQPLNSCLKPTNTKKEPEIVSLVTAICDTFSCQKFYHKIPTELPIHVHFRLYAYDSIHVKKPSFFLEFWIHSCSGIRPVRYTFISNHSAHVGWKRINISWCLSLVRWALWWTFIWSHHLSLWWRKREQDEY